MKFFKYKSWDGTQQPFSLKRKDIIDQFMEKIMKGLGPDMSYAEMLWQGFSLTGMDFRVMGLEEMINELKKKMYDLFAQYSLEKVFDRPMEDIRALLREENITRSDYGEIPVISYEELPPGLFEKLIYLESIEFIDEDSAEILSYWTGRKEEVLELYEFYGEYHEYFTGETYLDFDEAIELMRRFKSIDDLKNQLMDGDISTIDLQQLKDILGDDAANSIMILVQIPDILNEEGMVQYGRGGVNLTPKGMRRLEELAFGKLYRQIKRDKQGRNLGNAPQSCEILPDSSRPYQYGDRFDLDVTKTILSSITAKGKAASPVRLEPDGFYVREREQYVTSTVVLLLDLSLSMAIGSRFEAAKKVALAMDHYIRSRFPRVRFHIVGFSTEAKELKRSDLAGSTCDAAQPFTNLQAALRISMDLVRKSGNRNNRVIIITDGQPTAYYINNELHVEMPVSMSGLSRNACRETLTEVRKVTAQGMNMEIFMLDDSPVLVEFTRQITRINGGRSVLCLPDDLGRLIIREEIKRRGGKV